ncbi:fatty acid desaturase family protein [Archangium violaceum]|uniref:fatty acid desaturase family protein n=1 Tax=Archangium violaceum TaxID=83451 RepID=UPI00194F67C1|nr:fatty acid desaturase family protein [Archangium violaceum]QRO01980.1 fatty acid desaturase family protein [Archangium violaceum]
MSELEVAPEVWPTGTGREVGRVPQLIGIETLRRLSEVKPVVSTWLIALQYGGAAAAIWVSERWWNPLLYVVAVMFIGARQQALGLLMHDASHFRLYRNRKLNDWVGDNVLAKPIFQSMYSYRAIHNVHHQQLLSEADNDHWFYRHFPVSRRSLVLDMLASLCGYDAFKFFKQMSDGKPLLRVGLVGLFAGLVGLTVAGFYPVRLLLLYWLVPAFTWLFFISFLRMLAEHSIEIPGHPALLTRSWDIRLNLFERLFVLPQSNAYHAAHHLYPSVPAFQLPQLQRLLSQHPVYQENVPQARGLLKLLREKTGEPVRPSAP